ncbi:glutathione S-transferase N-terminal domain-containing protein [Adlercreutzia agrestimuris]|uniref:glutathione S-transferase N-terminal domain-containing protein n=1 Tax=Adlercreutzia agrestimuris TaxID=2941324 RepID=UPI00203E2F3E|nr:glutathione S-transferase N-terminal domain-containing protein [Adlercreutzia agrestimuris]
MKTIENAVLYYKPTCPFCHKVISYLENNKLNIKLANILEGDNREKLITLGGKAQVPCLVHQGKALYESDDIIAWIKENYC